VTEADYGLLQRQQRGYSPQVMGTALMETKRTGKIINISVHEELPFPNFHCCASKGGMKM